MRSMPPDSKMAILRRELLAASGLIAIVGALFADLLSGTNVLFFRDVTRYYVSAKWIAREALLSGDLLWNRWWSNGQPLAANPQFALFYPPTWLLMLPRYETGFALFVVVHFFAAALGMFIFGRTARFSIAASFFGGVAFAFSGTLLSMSNMFPFLAIVWIPWSLSGVILLARERTARAFALAAVPLGFVVLNGEPVTLIIGFALVGVIAIVAAPRRETMRYGTVVACVFPAALAMGAVQLIPSVMLMAKTSRASGVPADIASYWSLPPLRLAEFLLSSRWWDWPVLYPREQAPFYFSIDPGAIVIAFAAAALMGRLRSRLILLSVCAIFLLLAIGPALPLFTMFRMLPVLRSLRSPEKFVAGAVVIVVALAMAGFDAVISDRRGARMAAGIALVIATLAALGSLHGSSPVESSLAAFLCLAALLCVLLRRFDARLRKIALVVLCLADLSLVIPATVPRMPASFASEPSSAPHARLATRGGYLFHEVDWHKDSPISRSYLSGSESRYWMIRNGLFPFTGARWGVPTTFDVDLDRTLVTRSRDLVDMMIELKQQHDAPALDALLSRANVTSRAMFFPVEQAIAASGGDLAKVQPVAIVPFAGRPRYDFARGMVPIGDAGSFKRFLHSRPDPSVAAVDRPPFSPAAGRIVALHETSSSADLDVETTGTAFLVTRVTWDPGWTAFIDDRPAPIVHADYAFQGLEVTAGHHRIALRYTDRAFNVAAVLSLTSALALLLWLLCEPLVALRKRVRTQT